VTRLTDIPVRIEPLARLENPAMTAGLGGGVVAILSELVTLLELLAGDGSAASIDLRSLPMSPADRAQLQQVLGEGEVQATLTAQGVSRIRETRVCGVWWVEHFGQDRELVAESIEVTLIPDILKAAVDEIGPAAGDLRLRIEALTTEGRTGTHVIQ
jgi:hydrogenase-1 operon protein HyaF